MQIEARHYATGDPLRITTEGALITSIEPIASDDADVGRLPFVGPGVLDIQINGFGGSWFSSESLTVADVTDIIWALAQRGVARCLPALITNSQEALCHGMQVIAEACRSDKLVESVVRGIHLEGPWISSADGPRGAHPLRHVRDADAEELRKLVEASGGLLRLLTIAPEVPGVVELIQAAREAGIVVSIGHTGASYEEISAAVDAGASLCTHLGNGCAAQIDRHHNPIWPQLADDRLTACIISDGFHLPDEIIRAFVRCKGDARIVVTCDASGFAGCATGRHTAGDLEVEILGNGKIVVAGQRQYLAGSGATTLECVPPLIRATGVSPVRAWQFVTANPETAVEFPHLALTDGAEATFNVWHPPGGGDRGVSLTGGDPIRPVTTIVRGTRVDPVV